jgi:hypothetical protein
MNRNKAMILDVAFTSSSSSDSDDENMEIFLNKDKCRKKTESTKFY